MAASIVPSGRAARWSQHNADRREKVVTAAIRVLEASPPGAELSVQKVAEEAGIVRTVIYRHFEGKPELLRAVQAQVATDLRESLDAEIRLDRSLQQIVNAAVGTYVAWADANPELYVMIERDLGDGKPSELAGGVELIAQRIVEMVRLGADLSEMEMRGVDYALLETVAFGMIGQIRGTVGHWLRSTPRRPSAAELTTILTRSLWFQLAGQAKDIGIELNPTTALGELFAAGR